MRPNLSPKVFSLLTGTNNEPFSCSEEPQTTLWRIRQCGQTMVSLHRSLALLRRWKAVSKPCRWVTTCHNPQLAPGQQQLGPLHPLLRKAPKDLQSFLRTSDHISPENHWKPLRLATMAVEFKATKPWTADAPTFGFIPINRPKHSRIQQMPDDARMKSTRSDAPNSETKSASALFVPNPHRTCLGWTM